MMTSNNYDLFHNNINKKIKILEVINSLNIGGAELLLRNFVIEAKKNNQYTVDICTLYASNDTKDIEEIKKKNVRIWSLDLKNKYTLSSVGKIKKIIERENYDIIHAHLFPASAFVALSSLFLPNNIAYIFTEHSTFNRRRATRIFKIVDGFIYNRYSKIICSSKQVQNSLIKWIPKNKEKTEVIPNGTPTHSKPVIGQMIKKYDILFVGRLVPQKGIRFLLEAINILQNKYKKNIKVAIVGEGPLEKKLKTICEKLKITHSVKFLGFRRDIDQLMKSSKVFVLPSCWEGFGIVIIEAMKNRLPIVATNIGGIPEIITNGNEGVLVPRENPEILASSINHLLEDKKLRNKFIQNAYKKVQNKYKKNIKVAIVGEGPLEKKLKTICEKLKITHSVKFLGFRRDIDQLMKSSKVFVLPSCWEGFGIVIIEAMKNRLPIVATNIGGIPEIITNGKEGVLVPRENPEILASSINHLLEDKKLRNKFIQNAYKKVQEEYSIEKYTDTMLNLYSNIVKKYTE